VLAARARLAAAAAGEGETHCVECGEEVPEARRRALPGARTCVSCQSARDARTPAAGINRGGSKDSQLSEVAALLIARASPDPVLRSVRLLVTRVDVRASA
jgi:phage/conjugal plasmid C-4 type zinc finger TraR family protein